MSDAPALRDYFTREILEVIGGRIEAVHAAFDVGRFVDSAWAPADGPVFESLTFTERSVRIAEAVNGELGLDPVEMMDVLVRSLPEELPQADGALNEGFLLWPFGDMIRLYGTNHLDEGLQACYELTKRFTSEFAIRPFLADYPKALDRIGAWTDDPSEHVRRLVSEGTRPRLPWAVRLDLPIDDVLSILERLRADPSPYVRKSVANHLNDLTKVDRDLILDLAERWHATEVDETQWIVRHALRNELKAGNPRALAIFGYGEPDVDVSPLTVEPASVAIGDSVEISFDVTSRATSPQRVMIDLIVGYQKANGKISPKVFKFRDIELGAGATERCTKRLDMVVRSTRTLYVGGHSVTVQINGQQFGEASFELTD